MPRLEPRIGSIGRSLLVAAALLAGPALRSSQAAEVPVFEGAASMLDACRSAQSAFERMRVGTQMQDEATRPLLTQTSAELLRAMRAVADAKWPRDMRSERREVRRLLAGASAPITRLQRARGELRPDVVLRAVESATRNLFRAVALVEDTAPKGAGLDNSNPTVPTALPAPASPDFTWTSLSPSSDSRVVYVSSSIGSDSYNGLSGTVDGGGVGPTKTVAAGVALLRNGYPDWLLFKRGDTWDGESIRPTSPNQNSGRSATERMVFSSYGTGARPRFIDGQYGGILISLVSSHMAFVGLHFERQHEANTRDTGLFMLGSGSNFLIEDCHFLNFALGIQGDPSQGDGRYRNVQVRGCAILDVHSSSSLTVGAFCQRVTGLTFEGCVFDHNGWDYAGSDPLTVFEHNLYVQAYDSSRTCAEVVIRNNIFARSDGLQLRSGGICEDNLFLRCVNAYVMGDAAGDTQSYVRGNVVLDGMDFPGQSNGSAFDIAHCPPNSAVEMSENIAAHQVTSTGGRAFSFGGYQGNTFMNVNLHDNIAYKWQGNSYDNTTGIRIWNVTVSGTNTFANNMIVFNRDAGQGRLVRFGPDYAWDLSKITFRGNTWYSAQQASMWFDVPVVHGANQFEDYSAFASDAQETGGSASNPASSFPSPERTIETYMTSRQGTATLEAFLAEARLQNRANWRPEYTAKAVVNYIRAGFGRSPR